MTISKIKLDVVGDRIRIQNIRVGQPNETASTHEFAAEARQAAEAMARVLSLKKSDIIDEVPFGISLGGRNLGPRPETLGFKDKGIFRTKRTRRRL